MYFSTFFFFRGHETIYRSGIYVVFAKELLRYTSLISKTDLTSWIYIMLTYIVDYNHPNTPHTPALKDGLCLSFQPDLSILSLFFKI